MDFERGEIPAEYTESFPGESQLRELAEKPGPLNRREQRKLANLAADAIDDTTRGGIRLTEPFMAAFRRSESDRQDERFCRRVARHFRDLKGSDLWGEARRRANADSRQD
jgi:hypothetical protein